MPRLLPLGVLLVVLLAFAGGLLAGRRLPGGAARAAPAGATASGSAATVPAAAPVAPTVAPAAPPPAPEAVVTGESTGAVGGIRFESAITADAGTWKGVHGFDGYAVVGSQTLWPAWATVTITGQQGEHVWANGSEERRGLQRLEDDRRVAGCWHGPERIEISVVGSVPGRRWITLSAIDWDGHGNGRVQEIEAIAADGSVADRRRIERFGRGALLTWSFADRIVLRVTNRNPAANAVVSGLFFASAAPAR